MKQYKERIVVGISVVFMLVFLISNAAAVTNIYGCSVLDNEGETYLLQQDIYYTTPLGTCIKITADNIVFDGQGHTIKGMYPSRDGWFSTAIQLKSQQPDLPCVKCYEGVCFDDNRCWRINHPIKNVEIRNVKLSNWDTGIIFISAHDCLIENVEAKDCQAATVFAAYSSGNLIRNSAVQGCDLNKIEYCFAGNNTFQNITILGGLLLLALIIPAWIVTKRK